MLPCKMMLTRTRLCPAIYRFTILSQSSKPALGHILYLKSLSMSAIKLLMTRPSSQVVDSGIAYASSDVDYTLKVRGEKSYSKLPD